VTQRVSEESRTAVIEGRLKEERWGSVGFRLADQQAPALCREAAREMLEAFQLTWIDGLAESVELMVSELVTNACRYGGNALPAGSFTLWHPNRWLVLTVHDKNPYEPFRELAKARRSVSPWLEESGRGLALVSALAAEHCGELDYSPDYDQAIPGKVARVKMLLPNVMWRHTFKDPWRDRVIQGYA
jgi:anti-sigma regulatory factor (Ser/Thr protein kinase)